MASPYEGTTMRIEMTGGAEAYGTFQRADNETYMVTFTNVRWIVPPEGSDVDPSRILPKEQFHSSILKALTVVEDPPAAPPARPPQPQQHSAPPKPKSAWGQPVSGDSYSDASRQRAIGSQPAQRPPVQQSNVNTTSNYHRSREESEAEHQQAPAPSTGRAWGRGRATGRAAQPPARAAQPAPTAGAAPSDAPAAPSSWARAVGGGTSTSGRSAASSGRGRGRGRSGGRGWTPGIPKGDSHAVAVADDFDFTANNSAFEAEKPSFLAELGLEPGGQEDEHTPPGERKPQFEDDFFDNISHSLNEKAGIAVPIPRPCAKEQRQINMETFGAASVPRNVHQRSSGRGYSNNGGGYSGRVSYRAQVNSGGRRGGNSSRGGRQSWGGSSDRDGRGSRGGGSGRRGSGSRGRG